MTAPPLYAFCDILCFGAALTRGGAIHRCCLSLHLLKRIVFF